MNILENAWRNTLPEKRELPTQKPENPCFSSGPCAKRPGWSPQVLKNVWSGRSHRAAGGQAKLEEIIARSRRILDLPKDYRLGIVPASGTGAVEMALWSLLGERGVDVLAWESFGEGWGFDVKAHLGIEDLRIFRADYGGLPDLSAVDCDRDIVFTWNGTASGVRVPHADWISRSRGGLTICDATSAVFAQDLAWDKLDVVAWSWQKVLGGEAAHGMLSLSPRAVARLEAFTPNRPLPKIFRLTKKGKINGDIFKGATINTPSMLAVEDALDALKWAEEIGGITALKKRCDDNLAAIAGWVAQRDWVDFLAEDEATLSNTSICLKITASWFTALDQEAQRAWIKSFCALLEERDAAYDIAGYRDAAPGLRIWGGATVELKNTLALLPWLDWAYGERAGSGVSATSLAV